MNEDQLYRVPLLLNINLTLMHFVAKLQQYYYDQEKLKGKEKVQEVACMPREERSDQQIEDLIDFRSSDADKPTEVTQESTEKTEELQPEEEKVESTEVVKSEASETIKFHYQLVSNLIEAISNLLLNFKKVEKVKEYLVKMDFLEKSFIFISNRIERFPRLINAIYE